VSEKVIGVPEICSSASLVKHICRKQYIADFERKKRQETSSD